METPARRALAGTSLGTPATAQLSSAALRSRHSLYGAEDRVILELGHALARVGYSGESAPRHAQYIKDAWCDRKAHAASEDDWQLLEHVLKLTLRQLFHDHLKTDPRTRKVLVVEPVLMPTSVKALIARLLFDNLQVPSLNFASAPVLSLMASGALTGLVLDVGHAEASVTPVFGARPLHTLVLSTPLAGATVNDRLRLLLEHHASYVAPPATASSAPARGSPTQRVRVELLTDEVIEDIKTRLLFVGNRIRREARQPSAEGEVSQGGDEREALARALGTAYKQFSTSTSVTYRIPSGFPPKMGELPTSTSVPATGRGWLRIPGWVRERAAEALFESSDEDARSLPDLILESLLRLPVDLRRPLVSSVLVTGGTAMLPGFTTRLRSELQHTLSVSYLTSPPPSPDTTAVESTQSGEITRRRRTALRARLSQLRTQPRYAAIAPLASSLVILNDPSPHLGSSEETSPPSQAAGQAPAFAPALLPWVGGSLAGSLRTGGEEVSREAWSRGLVRVAAPAEEAADAHGASAQEQPELERMELDAGDSVTFLPDWTRTLAGRCSS